MSFALSSFGEYVCICGPPLWLELEMSLAVVSCACLCHVATFHLYPKLLSYVHHWPPLFAKILLSLQWEDLLAVPACSELCRKRELSPIHLPLPSRSAAPAWKGQPSSNAPPSQEYPVQVSVQANSVYFSGIPLNTITKDILNWDISEWGIKETS